MRLQPRAGIHDSSLRKVNLDLISIKVKLRGVMHISYNFNLLS